MNVDPVPFTNPYSLSPPGTRSDIVFPSVFRIHYSGLVLGRVPDSNSTKNHEQSGPSTPPPKWSLFPETPFGKNGDITGKGCRIRDGVAEGMCMQPPG